MKKDGVNKIRLGLFVTGTVVLFILGIFFIGQRQGLFARTIDVHFRCANVNGLQAGDKVRFSGIDVGTVASVQIVSDTTARVVMALDRKTEKFIKKDAQASVGSEGLMGDKVVNIAPGDPNQKEIQNGDIIQCVEGTNMDAIMVHVKAIASNADRITSDMADIVDNIHNGKGSIGKLFMDSSFANNMAATMVNIKQGAGGFKQNMVAVQHSFLLKGYFKRKKDKKEKEEKEAKDKQKTQSDESK